MHDNVTNLPEILLLILAAVVFVPLARRAGLGSILGYLAAGAVLGPWVSGLITEVEVIRHVAEFGVVFLLFLIGIEMKPARLWTMRRQVFGMGGLQVLITGAAIGTIAVMLGIEAGPAVIIGLGLALSSTAMGLQVLTERRELNSPAGRFSFSILLLQDLCVPILLTLVPLLGEGTTSVTADIGIAIAESLAILGGALLLGRVLLKPVLRLVAMSRASEVFTAFALLIVLGMAWIMEHAGLSMALGAFLAGLLLADSEYRHQVEADILPFRGLLLGLFFMGVGMTIDFGLLAADWPMIIAIVAGLMALKAVILAPLTRAFGLDNADAIKTAGLLCQGGEFGFVLFSFAVTRGAMEDPLAQILVLSISLSMALTPLTVMGVSRLAGGMALKAANGREAETPPSEHCNSHVIIAGFGRVGQTIAAMLDKAGRSYVAFDLDLEKVAEGRAKGCSVYYGDASRAEVLRAAHAENACVVVVTMDDTAAVARTVSAIRTHYPNLPIHARARDLQHSQNLRWAGADAAVPETLEASLHLGRSALVAAGIDDQTAREVVWQFREDDYAVLIDTIDRTR